MTKDELLRKIAQWLSDLNEIHLGHPENYDDIVWAIKSLKSEMAEIQFQELCSSAMASTSTSK
jgi:hypothetical protein